MRAAPSKLLCRAPIGWRGNHGYPPYTQIPFRLPGTGEFRMMTRHAGRAWDFSTRTGKQKKNWFGNNAVRTRVKLVGEFIAKAR